ncbi:hypothetical protein [Rhodohalobacter sulfatireducens]|uniref:Alpha-1,2-fucosyltransferase n=1 Tax=Rhodohalobacter sulfatireducens TaxID=2911366 RepID=A0ABS9KD21_9BACT|nr:hypothetical protein [Rhodohalobacter sulfatireducens]MCG2588712.1 hypothetical protein [Rhodohalobacter sulfatireducens]
MITVKPYGGLGNRIRVLYSVIGINREVGHEIKILWGCSKDLNCPFDELFIHPDNCRVRNFEQGLIKTVYEFSLRKLRFSKLRPYFYDLVLTKNKILEIKNETDDFSALFKNHSSIYLESCISFYEGPKIEDLLTIHPDILNRAETIFSRFKSPTYGIHIRSTDNQLSKKYSPPVVFENFIRKKLEEESNAWFFLATDSKEVESELIESFGDRILTSNNNILDRNSRQGIKNALVDMVCLSRTKKVYGSYFSSFSSISAMLTGIECENVTTDSFDHGVDDI